MGKYNFQARSNKILDDLLKETDIATHIQSLLDKGSSAQGNLGCEKQGIENEPAIPNFMRIVMSGIREWFNVNVNVLLNETVGKWDQRVQSLGKDSQANKSEPNKTHRRPCPHKRTAIMKLVLRLTRLRQILSGYMDLQPTVNHMYHQPRVCRHRRQGLTPKWLIHHLYQLLSNI